MEGMVPGLCTEVEGDSDSDDGSNDENSTENSSSASRTATLDNIRVPLLSKGTLQMAI